MLGHCFIFRGAGCVIGFSSWESFLLRGLGGCECMFGGEREQEREGGEKVQERREGRQYKKMCVSVSACVSLCIHVSVYVR